MTDRDVQPNPKTDRKLTVRRKSATVDTGKPLDNLKTVPMRHLSEGLLYRYTPDFTLFTPFIAPLLLAGGIPEATVRLMGHRQVINPLAKILEIPTLQVNLWIKDTESLRNNYFTTERALRALTTPEELLGKYALQVLELGRDIDSFTTAQWKTFVDRTGLSEDRQKAKYRLMDHRTPENSHFLDIGYHCGFDTLLYKLPSIDQAAGITYDTLHNLGSAVNEIQLTDEFKTSNQTPYFLKPRP